MTDQYCKDVLKVVVAQICQTIGWNGIQSSALEIMIDILNRYLRQLCRQTHRYSEQFGMTQPNMDHVALMMRDLHIQAAELEEYVNWVEPLPCTLTVPKIPIPRPAHLCFLKPGSREVVTRPVHVHEHLPPMYPEMEVENNSPINGSPAELNSTANSSAATINVTSSPELMENETVFKRPGDPISDNQILKKPRLSFGEEGRPTREISSVMMTSSGFLSPAREGKLPEARTPHNMADSPAPTSQYPNVPPELRVDKKIRKVPELKKKEHPIIKELFKPDKVTVLDNKVKKLAGMKEVAKLKAFKSGASKYLHQNSHMNTTIDLVTKVLSNQTTSSVKVTETKIQKTSLLMTVKPVKIEDPPIISTPPPPLEHGVTLIEIDDQGVRKLTNEPDKVKLNIFKKISSKSKDDKSDKLDKGDKKSDSHFDFHAAASTREFHAVDIIPINEPIGTAKTVIKKEDEKAHTPEITIKDEILFSAVPARDRPPTPSIKHHNNDKLNLYPFMTSTTIQSTPKTPDIQIHSPPRKVEKEKKKRKDKMKKIKNKTKPVRYLNSRKIDASLGQRPITPDDPVTITKTDSGCMIPAVLSFYSQLSGGPGLIPTPNPLLLGMSHMSPPCRIRDRHGFGEPPLILSNPVMSLKNNLVSQPKSELTVQPVIEKINPSPTNFSLNKPIKTENEVLVSDITTITKIEKKTKEHKKEKKDKLEKKIRKKKDKKDKKKGKDKAEKKPEKEDRKDKEKVKVKKEKKEKHKDRINVENAVPKLTLKLGPQTQRTPTPEPSISRKITIKPVMKSPEEENGPKDERELSPELARISALVTRPPKTPKPATSTSGSVQIPNIASTSASNNNSPPRSDLGFHAKLRKTMFKPLPKLKSKDLMKKAMMVSSEVYGEGASSSSGSNLVAQSSVNYNPMPHPAQVMPIKGHTGGAAEDKDSGVGSGAGATAGGGGIASGGNTRASSGAASAVAPAPSLPPAPILPPPRAHAGPGRPRGSSNAAKAAAAAAAAAAASSAQQANDKHSMGKVGNTKASSNLDKDGNKVWICPACGGQDDGSPMIGCDDCDAWYHWVCVGIQIPPDANEDWYCKICIGKKQEILNSDKKKKRKKKEKKDH